MTAVVRAHSLPPRTLIAATLALAMLSACAQKAPPVAPAGPPPSAPAALSTAPTLEPPLASVDRGAMAPELDPFFAAPGLRTAVWSVLVQSLDTGEVLYRLNPNTLVLPASNQKIVSTAVAAARLGWDFRFETRLEITGDIVDGELRGDLFLVGNGDPTINDRNGRRETFFDDLAAALRAAGIRRVAGRLIGDDDAFDDERFGAGWSWDDFAESYSAPVGALQVNENSVDVVVTPGDAVGHQAGLSLRQKGSDLVLVDGLIRTGAPGSETRVRLERYPGDSHLIVRGSVPFGGKEVVHSAAVDNPTLYFVGETKLALGARGVEIRDAAVDWDDVASYGEPVERRVVGRLPSPPLSEIAKPLMKVSQNLYAETFLRALSLGPAPATVDASEKKVEDTLGRWGVPKGTFVVADGSGLSRYNYVNASMIVAILRGVARDPKLYEAFAATLPIGGKDGTIANRMKGTRAEGNVRAKTGSLMSVRALSGYLTSLSGERIVFSAIANNFTTPNATVDAAVEQALERVIARARP